MLPQAPPFDESMLPPGSMRPVFPKVTTETAGLVADEAAVNAAAAVKTRAAYFAALAADPEFTAHVIDGWLREQENDQESRLTACPAADVVEERAAWRMLKEIRRRLRTEIVTAPAKLKS